MESGSYWHHDISLIKPGNSAILGDNYWAFYGVHIIGMLVITVSTISSVVVILNILSHRCTRNWDFSDRFPLYLAIADGLWGISNLTTDHIVLLVTKVFPPSEIATLLSINLGMFLGYCKVLSISLKRSYFYSCLKTEVQDCINASCYRYQQLMNSGLALYTYFKVVRHNQIDLGRGEWKLHLMCVAFIVSIMMIFIPLDGFGCTGYW
jgi:hypothetical protein